MINYQERKVKYVATNLIDPSKDNRLAEKQLEPITTVKDKGILNAIYVLPTANGRYEVVAGDRRRYSAQLYGLEQCPIIECENEDEAMVIKALENLDRKDLEPMDVARQINILLDKGMDGERIASMLHISMWQFNRRLRLLKLHKELVKLLDNKEISLSVAEALATVDGKTKQLEVYKFCTMYGKKPTANDIINHVQKLGVSLLNCSDDFLSYESKKDGIRDCKECPNNSCTSCLFAEDSEPICNDRQCYLRKVARWAESQNLSVLRLKYEDSGLAPMVEQVRPEVVRTVESVGRTIVWKKPTKGKFDTMVSPNGKLVWISVPDQSEVEQKKTSDEELRKIRRAFSDSAKEINRTLATIGRRILEKLQEEWYHAISIGMDKVTLLRLVLNILGSANTETCAQLCRYAYADSGIRPIDFCGDYVDGIVSPIWGRWYSSYGVGNIAQVIADGVLTDARMAEAYAMAMLIVTVHTNPLYRLPATGYRPAPMRNNQLIDFAVTLGIEDELIAQYNKQVSDMTEQQIRLGNTSFGILQVVEAEEEPNEEEDFDDIADDFVEDYGQDDRDFIIEGIVETA